ncbi:MULTISPECIES: DegV family protein [unclassified Lactobacillus]|uniref:DegV family protein n=1 Tax=unclassified Lactobacillus TaxID=2620435 RepID=UPI0023F9E958|nr:MULTISPECIES: DegV family protein [unclassified Lactobacillus]MDF7668841.1 DegV family protein [Lactobacillus sp. ESL0703]WEV38464.1 DegV family protein [Lactobacillus sp. ESL0680]
MDKIKIIIDSSSNELSNKQENIEIVPLTITINQQNFVDDETLDLNELSTSMAANTEAGKTACPSIDDWLRALAGSTHAIMLTVTSGLSGSYSSAYQAKKIYEENHPESRIIVVDSKSAGPELSLTLHEIQRLIKNHVRFVDFEQKIAHWQTHTHLLAVLQSLHNLSLNGRISPAVAKVAQMLKINIVAQASTEGKLEPLDKIRGMKRALKDVISRMEERGFHGGEVIIDHFHNLKDATSLKEKIIAKYPQTKILIRPVKGLCGFYIENGGLMIGFQD